jgi:hypothetical protein
MGGAEAAGVAFQMHLLLDASVEVLPSLSLPMAGALISPPPELFPR